MNFIVVRLLLIVFSYSLTILTAVYFGALYTSIFPYASGGSFIGDPDTLKWIIGYPLGLIFLLTFLMHLQGRKHVWWWNIIALLPAIAAELLFDPLHLYFPIALGGIGWMLSTMANRMLRKLAPRFMAKLG